jgi:hypothetical protein
MQEKSEIFCLEVPWRKKKEKEKNQKNNKKESPTPTTTVGGSLPPLKIKVVVLRVRA